MFKYSTVDCYILIKKQKNSVQNVRTILKYFESHCVCRYLRWKNPTRFKASANLLVQVCDIDRDAVGFGVVIVNMRTSVIQCVLSSSARRGDPAVISSIDPLVGVGWWMGSLTEIRKMEGAESRVKVTAMCLCCSWRRRYGPARGGPDRAKRKRKRGTLVSSPRSRSYLILL